MDRAQLESDVRLLSLIEKNLDAQATVVSSEQHHHAFEEDVHELLVKAWAKVQDAKILIGRAILNGEARRESMARELKRAGVLPR